MTGDYEDIIGLPHRVSEKYPRMSPAERAAQFAPFAALTGFSAIIAETGRLTDTKIELGEEEKAALNDRMHLLRKRPVAAITYYVPDEKKDGGAYVTITGMVKKVDEYARVVVMASGVKIPMDDILQIDCETPPREKG